MNERTAVDFFTPNVRTFVVHVMVRTLVGQQAGQQAKSCTIITWVSSAHVADGDRVLFMRALSSWLASCCLQSHSQQHCQLTIFLVHKQIQCLRPKTKKLKK